MPSKTPILRQEAARRLIGDRRFSAGGDRGPVGSPLGAHAGGEVEWLPVSTHNAESHIPLRDTRGAVAAAGTLPGGCRVTFEPGGQLELSSPADLPSAACQAVAEDLAHLRRHLSDYGITLAGMGRDPLRPERRGPPSPPHVAVEQYFAPLRPPRPPMVSRTAPPPPHPALRSRPHPSPPRPPLSAPARLRRGWGLRMTARGPHPGWRVPPLVATALVADPEAAERAARACAGATELWMEAARVGLSHPALAAAAAECMEATIDALPRIGAFGGAAWAVEAFHDQFTSRGRCPADDLLDAWASTGALFPNDQPLEPAS